MKILVGVDESARSERALRWALREATARDATVSVVHVFDVPSLRGPLDREVHHEGEHRHARALVEEMVARTGRRGTAVPVREAVCSGGAERRTMFVGGGFMSDALLQSPRHARARAPISHPARAKFDNER